MTKKTLLSLAGATLVAILAAVSWGLPSLHEQALHEQALHEQDEEQRKLVLAAETSLLPTTVWLAEKNGYFAAEGLEVEIRDFDSGRNALETMLRDDSIDIATVASTPVVFNSFTHPSFKIIASMASSVEVVKVLALKERGILHAGDLPGKRIGVTLRSTGHYFLESFLAHYGYSVSDVELVDVDAARLPVMLAAGEIDAISTWEPHIAAALESIGEERLVLLLSPAPFREMFFFAARDDRPDAFYEATRRFLKALLRAEDFSRENPRQSQEIVAERLTTSTELVARLWDLYYFEIALEQSILVALEDEARWAIRRGYTDQDVPNYLDFISWRALEEVKPERVTIIHQL